MYNSGTNGATMSVGLGEWNTYTQLTETGNITVLPNFLSTCTSWGLDVDFHPISRYNINPDWGNGQQYLTVYDNNNVAIVQVEMYDSGQNPASKSYTIYANPNSYVAPFTWTWQHLHIEVSSQKSLVFCGSGQAVVPAGGNWQMPCSVQFEAVNGYWRGGMLYCNMMDKMIR